MNDKQLYRYIQRVLEQKKSLNTDNDPHSFAQKYVRQQIIKKKLVPYDSSHKINALMKKFKGLDTFINVPEIIQSIKIKTFHHKEQPITSNQQLAGTNTTMLRNLMNKTLGKSNNVKFEEENLFLQKIINNLQKDSHIITESLKNNSNHDQTRIFKQIFTNNNSKNQQIYQSASAINSVQRKNWKNADFLNFCNKKGLNLQQNKKYTQLLHKATTYLHIILENQHRNKWKSNKAPSSHSVNRKQLKQISKHKKKINNKQTSYSSPNDSNYSTFHQSYFSNPNNSQFKFNIKKKAGDKFSFPKKTFKEGILNKLQNFIEDIANEQYLIGKENKMYIKTLNKVQKHLTNQFSEFKDQPLANDNDIQEVRKAAEKFKAYNQTKK